MKEELLKHLGDIAEMTKEGIVAGVDILKIQCPDLVAQVIRWELLSSAICMVLGLVGFIGLTKLVRYSSKRIFTDDEECWIPGLIFGGFGSVAGLVMFIGSIFTVGKILVAPKLFLIQYISNLLK